MPHVAIEQALSTPRFSTYRAAILSVLGEECPVTALELYQWNAQLASRFFLPLHIYEVALRNAISDAICLRYGSNWPVNTYFQNSLNYQDKRTLTKAIDENGYNGVGKLLPELKFVWFENMLTARHDGRIWSRYFKTVFPNSPSGLDTALLRRTLKESCYVVRKFRNRCGHHEPIFNNPNLLNVLPLMCEAIAWRSEETHKWFHEQESVTVLLNAPII
ncbi:hypothetical protein ACSTJQ_12695 [Vibrio parahaemolyticus]